jgi:hypothetical protein
MAILDKQMVAMNDQGPGRDWSADLEGYTVSLVELSEDADLTPLLKGLPHDQCQCPHWGYVIKGRMWWRYTDGEESCPAGTAFYVPPGHTAGADAGSEFVVFGPAELVREVDAHMAMRAQELQGIA